MANARTRFDTIVEYMIRHHHASFGLVAARPAAIIDGEAFVVLINDGVAFRLYGRVQQQALALPGSHVLNVTELPMRNPLNWVWVPTQHFLRWDRLAIEAMRCLKVTSKVDVIRAERPPEPAQAPQTQPPGLAERVANLFGGKKFLRFSFGLAPKEPDRKEEPPSELTRELMR